MKILGIETSCDDTCVAVIEVLNKKEADFKILSNIVSSQVEIHKKYGGVYPTLAKREHQKNLIPVLEKSLKEADLFSKPKKKIKLKKEKIKNILKREKNLLNNLKIFLKKTKKPKIDLIAATTGPGLDPCLWTGINLTKALALSWNLPVVPVNHIEAHILSNFVKRKPRNELFPAISLIISGGHTQLILSKKIGNYEIIGETRDDAAGECFDKTARILGLPYPGGPIIEKKAKKKEGKFKFKIELPRPMINSKNYDFSFSGLKTAVLYDFKERKKEEKESEQYIKEMAKEIQQAIIDVLIKKTIKTAKDKKAKSILLGGGVTANKELRKQLKEKIKKEIPKTEFLVPNIKYSGDNALIIAVTGFFRRENKKSWQEIKAEPNLRLK